MTIRQGKQIIANTQGTRNYDLLENKPKIDGVELSGEVTLDDLNVQSKLSAGTGIEIVDGVISNTQTKPEWGKITGNIAEQTDLQQELAKAGTPDDITVVKTQENKLQAISLINQNDQNANIKLWLGSEEDYEAVETKDENTVYFTKDGVIDISGEGSGGLEIGDIGIAPFGIDESLNKRRYLNGQVISQSQFVSFTNRIKTVIQLNPNLAATEENWQAEVTNSVLGQCGKFVIDDELGTIRLPKVVNIQGLQDLALIGNIKAESLPNIKGTLYNNNTTYQDIGLDGGIASGAIQIETDSVSRQACENVSGYDNKNLGWSFDASRSSSTYQDNAPVQQEAVQYPYFIQVATGVEESVDITREIELNNPFSLLDYKWSEYELNNASWLLSNGQFNSGATYISVYNLLLEIYNGTVTKDGVSVKMSTEAYTDTDFVLNTSDTTFRLPIKVKLASGNAVVGNGMTLGLTDGTTNYGSNYTSGNRAVALSTSSYGAIVGTTGSFSDGSSNVVIGVTTDPTKSGIETSSSGLKLYFYVGETIQDANIIVASNVLTNAVMKNSSADRETVIGWGIPDYSAGIAITTPVEATPFVAPCDGLYVVAGVLSNTNATLTINGRISAYTFYMGSSNRCKSAMTIPLSKNDICYWDKTFNAFFETSQQFYPFKGVN